MLSKKLEIKYKHNIVVVDHIMVHTLVIGSGAAGLNAAVQLYRNGVQDILILTEGLHKGTSINTGSDKQTYYKLSMCGAESDSPVSMAESYIGGGAMHGDLALIEASMSVRGFFNLVNLGVPFPHDAYGQFIGYKTDHDPRQRATSVGPYTSREMCTCLIKEVKRLGIAVLENREVIHLVRSDGADGKRIVAALVLGEDDALEVYSAENIVFAVGGPGGLYKTSVYPEVHSGAIGLALLAGADARNLPESQYGLASTKFRWNVSGTYMQVIPRFISTATDGISDEHEFLADFFKSPCEMDGNVFLKGYQWPFDARKVLGGSSIVDILVYIETVEKGRRVFLDFRQNPHGYSLENLPEEARNYLLRSEALQATPIERLFKMNPGAIELYRDHGIDLYSEPLEIAVCAQHNNGGLAANIWSESTNIRHFFPVGEVNGSHGVNRPGGSALNAGQVWSTRAAEYIAACYQESSTSEARVEAAIRSDCEQVLGWIESSNGADLTWQSALDDIQARMSRCGAHIRSKEAIKAEIPAARQLVEQLITTGCNSEDRVDLRNAFRVRQLAFAHLVYLESIRFMLENGVGSRGSSIVLDPAGTKVNPLLDDAWKIQLEDPAFKSKALLTQVSDKGEIGNTWELVRPIPEIDAWFETTWAAFRNGEIYGGKGTGKGE
jgi:succinate dehydrogenase/fumarate reductase flavoprotein subunit